MNYYINKILIEQSFDGKIQTDMKLQIVGTEKEYYNEFELSPYEVDQEDVVKLAIKVLKAARKGEWIPIGEFGIGYKCSACNKAQPDISKFCPECGAYMINK